MLATSRSRRMAGGRLEFLLWPLLLVTIAVIGGCTTAESEAVDALRAKWTAEWNARIDAKPVLRDHPCGDFAFDPWAQDFLAPCERYSVGAEMTPVQCEARQAWAWERSRQCNVWQQWLLRNHHKHDREDAAVEPDARVEL